MTISPDACVAGLQLPAPPTGIHPKALRLSLVVVAGTCGSRGTQSCFGRLLLPSPSPRSYARMTLCSGVAVWPFSQGLRHAIEKWLACLRDDTTYFPSLPILSCDKPLSPVVDVVKTLTWVPFFIIYTPSVWFIRCLGFLKIHSPLCVSSLYLVCF
jgi:hypothetical protein